ncbi:MAG: hypothetical protein ACJ75J_03385 [Cytophagaceae bacterium]
MIRNFLIALICLACWSCNSGKVSETSKTDSLTASGTNSESSHREWNLKINDRLLKDSVAIPSAFINSILPYTQEEGGWEIRTYLMIDSLKKNKKYEEYVESLDIGQTKSAEAWVYDTLEFGNTKAVLWGISHSSYEACPFFSGRSVYLSTFSAGDKAIGTQRILEISSGGDAPYYGSTSGECTLNSTGTISCLDSLVSGGETVTVKGKEYEEVVTSTVSRTLQIEKDGTIRPLKNTKSAEIKTNKLIEQ